MADRGFAVSFNWLPETKVRLRQPFLCCDWGWAVLSKGAEVVFHFYLSITKVLGSAISV